MLLSEYRHMAKGKGGRPRKEDGDGSTRQIRVFADIAVKIGDIIDVQGGSVANFVDDILRQEVEAKHAALKPLIDQMRKVREQAQKKDDSKRKAK